jgi:hypothetical protein
MHLERAKHFGCQELRPALGQANEEKFLPLNCNLTLNLYLNLVLELQRHQFLCYKFALSTLGGVACFSLTLSSCLNYIRLFYR